MSNFWFVIDSKKNRIRPDILARKARVRVDIASAWLSGNMRNIHIPVSTGWRLSDAAKELDPDIVRAIVPSRWWIREYMARSRVTPNELSSMLNRSLQSVKRWLKGDEADIIPLTNEDIEKMNIRYGLQYITYVKES